MKTKKDYLERKLSQAELEKLIATLGFGTSSNPVFIELQEATRKSAEVYEAEAVLVEEWQQSEELLEFQETAPSEVKATSLDDLDFMCDEPSSCTSFKNFGASCACIRKNFSCPTQFKSWSDSYITLMKDEVLQDLETYENENKNRN